MTIVDILLAKEWRRLPTAFAFLGAILGLSLVWVFETG